jgi:hypothetical protein
MTEGGAVKRQKKNNQTAPLGVPVINPIELYAPGKSSVCKNANRPLQIYPLASASRPVRGSIEYYENRKIDVRNSANKTMAWLTVRKASTRGACIVANGRLVAKTTNRTTTTPTFDAARWPGRSLLTQALHFPQ